LLAPIECNLSGNPCKPSNSKKDNPSSKPLKLDNARETENGKQNTPFFSTKDTNTINLYLFFVGSSVSLQVLDITST